MTELKDVHSDRVSELGRHFLSIVQADRNIDPGAAVNPADAYACYRLLLGRQPSDTEIAHLLWLNQSNVTYRDFLAGLLASPEYSRRSQFMPPNHVLMAQLPAFRFWFRTEDREMGVSMALGQYEPEVVAMLPKLVSAGDTCLDIGAQTGFFSMHLATLVGESGEVHAFEPLTGSYDILARNVVENKFGNIVRANNVACSSKNGEVHFSEHSGMLIASSSGEGTSFRTVRADDFGGKRVSFVKLDVEGHEVSVLDGMPRILSLDRPVILTEVNEYWLREAGQSGKAYLQQLESHGYVSLRTETLVPIDPPSLALDALDAINVLAVPVEALASVRARLS